MATIQGIYVALFGRPADPAGLAYFNQQTNNGADLTAIGDLSSTAEYQERFAGLNNVQIVTLIYQELFGRDPDAAGLAFFVAALNSGTQNINTIAINILDGAQGDDALVVANKIEAANLFTAEVDTAVEIGSYVGEDAADLGRAYLQTVTADPATVPTQAQAATAVQGVVDAGVAGNTFDLTAGQSVSTSANSEGGLLATNNNDVITVTGNYTGAGTINAGLGNDKLYLDVAAPVVPAAGAITNVERLYVTSTNAAASLDLVNVAGLQAVWNNDSGFNLVLNNVDAGTVLGISNGVGANTTFNVDGAAAEDDNLVDLVLADSADAGTVTISDVETINVRVEGPATVDYLNAAAAETVTVSGTGDLVLGGIFADDATVDASGHVGVLNFTVDGGQDGLTVIGGASNDIFTVFGGAEGIVLSGGAGNDLFDLNLSNLNDLTDNASILDDVIQITDFSASNDLLDINVGAVTRASLDNIESGNISAAANLEAALDVVAQATFDDAAGYAVFQYQGSTYVYVDSDPLDANLASGDGLVQLVGYTGDLNASNFTTAI